MNPFVYNTPVRGDDFFNREKMIDQILRETVLGKSQGNVWITGERQTGKSSLLRNIQLKYADFKQKIKVYNSPGELGAAFIYANVQDCRQREDFYRNLRQELKNFFDFKLDEKANFQKAFIQALEYAHKEKYYVLFLIDEFDAFIQNLINTDPHDSIAFLGELNKLSTHVDKIPEDPKVFGMVLAANASYDEMLNKIPVEKDSGSGLISVGKELTMFSQEQTAGLAKLYLENDNVEFTEHEIDFCYKNTQGYPYFTQRIFSIMYDMKINSRGGAIDLNSIQKEYAETFKTIIQNWGGEKMPARTLKRVGALAKTLFEKVALPLGFEFLKKQAGL